MICCMVPAYFMSICFYITAICGDFENLILDIEKTGREYDAIYSNLITAVHLQNSAGV